MKRFLYELAVRPRAWLDAANSIGRCATCPSITGVTVKPTTGSHEVGRLRGCSDLRRKVMTDRLPSVEHRGYTSVSDEFSICGRDEIAAGGRVYERRVTWGQVSRQLVRPETLARVGADTLRSLGNWLLCGCAMIGAMERGDWEAAQVYASGSYVLPPDHPSPPVSETLPYRIT